MRKELTKSLIPSIKSLSICVRALFGTSPHDPIGI
jgi:hypothetical protein